MFRQNKHGVFFPSPPSPETIASHEHLSLQPLGFLSAVILQVSCHRITSGFLMPTSGFARYVHTLCRDRDATPRTPSRENPIPRNSCPMQCWMARPEAICTPCTAFAEFALPLHSLSMELAWLAWHLHTQYVHTGPCTHHSPQQLVTPRSLT